jgi:hypothetical protein
MVCQLLRKWELREFNKFPRHGPTGNKNIVKLGFDSRSGSTKVDLNQSRSIRIYVSLQFVFMDLFAFPFLAWVP